jgi:dihydrofolate synthase/folylpolyglutamate synthase
VVSGVTQPGPRAVIRKLAADHDAPLWELGGEYGFDYRPARGGSEVVVATPRGAHAVRVGLLGEHQAANAAAAVAALDLLRDTGMPIPEAAVARGLADVRWPARVEVISERPAVILDMAHNVPSAEALVRTLHDVFPDAGRKAVVFAVSSDKQYPEILAVLAGYFDHLHLTKYGNNPRCVPPEKLAAVLDSVAPGRPRTVHATSPDAWTAARAACGPDDLVCVTGSVFLAGELRPVMTGEP